MKLPPNLVIEKSLWKKGFQYVAGIDEVGRGSWAGPVVAAAVILSHEFKIPEGFADSKQVKPQKRGFLANYIKGNANAWAVAEIPVSIINKLGIAKATQMAFRKAIKSLLPKPDFLLVDAFYIKNISRKNQKAIIHGDETSASIAAASIIAKVYRDNFMKKLSRKYKVYGFAKHKGYGTNQHQEAIKKFGFSNVHRTSYNLEFLLS